MDIRPPEEIAEWKEKNRDKTRAHFRKWYENGGREKLKEKRKNSTKDSPHRISLAKSLKKFPGKQRARENVAYARIKREYTGINDFLSEIITNKFKNKVKSLSILNPNEK